MNYLAHAMRYFDRPEFMAGTAVPDWLSVVDRRVRMRPKLVEPWTTHADFQLAEIAGGIAQHLWDDGWFHATRGFAEVTSQLAMMFRNAVDPGDGFRCGFLGHIVTEMLIDGVLIDEDPRRLNDYHAVLDQVDPQLVEQVVNRISVKPTNRLASFIELYRRERILESYQDSQSLLVRLNQVLRRVKLIPLPETAIRVLDEGRVLIRQRLVDLLPAEHFAVL